jgi:hypothetical protein
LSKSLNRAKYSTYLADVDLVKRDADSKNVKVLAQDGKSVVSLDEAKYSESLNFP